MFPATYFGNARDYLRAFKALQREGIPEKHIALLQAHFKRPKHTATWAELAVDVGYPGWSAVNLQYGRFAGRVARQLGVEEPPQGFWLFVLADWAEGKDRESGHTRFVLRRPVIDALMHVGILPKVGHRRTPDSEGGGGTRARVADSRRQEAQLAALEGDAYYTEARFRRRNRRLIEEKKRLSDGRCSVCGVKFQERYRGIDGDCLVAHHVKPIGKRKGASKTTLDDIDLLCPNCHAAVHTHDPPLTAAELRGMLDL